MMPSLDDTLIEYPLTMLKGEPGLRKSTCALSYPKPQYWISTDQKMEALVLPAKNWGIKRSDISYDDYNNWSAVETKLKQLQLNCPARTVILDSVTSLGDNVNRQTKHTKKSEGGGKQIAGINTNSIEDYNAEASAFQDAMAMLKDINKYHRVHVIIIAHVVGQRKDDPNNKSTHHSRVIITGGDKISGKIASYCTEVYHFNVKPAFEEDKEGQYALFTEHTGNDYARTSLRLPKEIVFNGRPLFNDFIEPAIRALKAEADIVNIPSTPLTPQTTQPF